ncbi:MAG: hypothetical protein AAF519_01890 [Bacteroidota bacterium]
MVKKGLWVFLCMTFSFGSEAQSPIRFGEVEKMPISINTVAEELRPLSNPNNKDYLFFTRVFSPLNKGGKFGGGDVWYVDFSDSLLIAKSNLPWNTDQNDELIGINEAGDTYYLRDPISPHKGFLFTREVDGKFLEPEKIQVRGLSKKGFMGFYMHPSYEILLISMEAKGSLGSQDLYVSVKDVFGKWGEPIHLGNTVNTPGFEISPFLSDDGLKLFFASNGHNGFGDADIYMSERQYGVWDVWSKPVNLGPKINSTKFDAYFSIRKDSVCFFSSNRMEDNSQLYQSKILPPEKFSSGVVIQNLIAETRDLLDDISNPESINKYNYVKFNSESDTLSYASIDLLDIWIESLKSIQVDSPIYLTFDSSIELGYEKKLLFSKRLNKVFQYLINEGVGEEMLVIERTGRRLNLDQEGMDTVILLLL